MALAVFEQLLKEVIGLDVASIGASAVERAVNQRREACSLPDPQAYWDHLQSNPEELQQLIDAVVVPETWFFRDAGAFTALTAVAVPEWLRSHSDGAFRVLSIPCATGEEPYSLAMALADAGLPAPRYLIDAFDVSEAALDCARRAVYGRKSFRGADLAFRDRYFQPVSGGYELAPAVRERVRFYQRNLLHPSLVEQADRYHVIFCRNLLIYFDRPTQDRAIGVLGRMLTPDGMLFVGPSETGVMLSHQFRSARIPMAFAFHRALDEPRQQAPSVSRPRTPVPRPRAATPAPGRIPFAPPAAASTPSPARATAVAPAALLDEAQQLADVGRFAEAAKSCEAHLRQHGPSAAAFYLLGLVHDAGRNAQAAESFYRKTLYLDPAHAGALAQLALLMDTQGRAADADLLRKRAQRASQKRSS